MGNGEQPRCRSIRAAYAAPMSRRPDPHVDVMLARKFAGHAGHTPGVGVDMMIAHGMAVIRASRQMLVLVLVLVLVLDDMPGASGACMPRPVHPHADVNGMIDDAAARYAHDVRPRASRGPEECFGVRGTILPG
ncbi:hypothetical protein [Komagataeibacter europaeus]|uniref:hypothetical protein n=1 Tax=Komagataeibacter europaeus TaxID=33995 RepID=UPI0002DAE4EE|nr:hypothetical protein [Komagataeibacter europaeus]